MDNQIHAFPDLREVLGLLGACGLGIVGLALLALALRLVSDWLDEWWLRNNRPKDD